MYTSINSNTLATQINGVYNRNQSYMNAALTKAATGQRINSAKDSPADWSISERMRERINSLNQVNQNVQNDSAFIKTASAGIQNDIDILKTLKERALNAANASTSIDDRKVLQAEVEQLIAQIDTNRSSVKFNGTALLQGVGTASSNSTDTTFYKALSAAATEDSTVQSAGLTSENGNAVTIKFTYDDAGGTTQTKTVSGSKDLSATYKISDLITDAGTALSGTGITLSLVAKDTAIGTDATTGNAINATTPVLKATSSDAFSNFKILFGSSDVAVSSDANTVGTVASTPTTVDPSATPDTNNKWFQVGADSGLQITFNIANMQSTKFGEDGIDLSTLNVTTPDKADASIQLIDQALTSALKEATKLGALEQRLGYTADNVATQIENMEASDSAIRDADMAKEMTNYMKYMVLSQASQYMLAQANQNGFSVLNLFQQ